MTVIGSPLAAENGVDGSRNDDYSSLRLTNQPVGWSSFSLSLFRAMTDFSQGFKGRH
jgi:hypothetical protein